MATLKNWYLNVVDGEYCIAHGIVTGHHRLPDGMDIHTSWLEEVSYDAEVDQVRLRTHSGTLYEMNISDIRLSRIELTQDVFGKYGLPTDRLAEGVRLQAEERRGYIEKIKQVSDSQILFCEFTGTECIGACFKDKSGKVHDIEITPHIGMFVDSYLVTDWENGLVDFRYFDRGAAGIECYHRSDGLDLVQIKNSGGSDLTFIGCHTKVCCPAGEVITIAGDDFSGGGLISPDAVNGKCMLT